MISNKDKFIKIKSNKKYRFLSFLLGLFIIAFILITIYGVFLYQKICNYIDGEIWHLPMEVYSRIINLEPNMPISKKEMIKLLESTQYHQVTKITYPGEFTIKGKSIEIIRRPFNFPDSKEGKIHARLIFNHNHLETIENMDNNHHFGFFRIDPRLITMFSSQNGEQRFFISRNNFPDLLVKTLLVTEDRYFYQHDGINFHSIGRAALANFIAKRIVQGASTLTQQLVKNLFLTNERSYWRKINEVYMAILMEANYSKNRILELYMNKVYLGKSGSNEIRGFPLASLYYFGCPMEALRLEQQALLVGMVKGASIYNPWKNPNLALERRNLILRLLQQQQIIDQKLYNTLKVRELGVQPQGNVISPQSAFIEMLRQEIQIKLGNKIKDLSGTKIFTTFDSITQNAAEKAVIEEIPILKKKHKLEDLETTIVIVDKYSGEIRAIVGSAEPQYAGYNRVIQARRSIGSLAKIATYLTAFNQPNRYRLNTWITDKPIFLYQPNGKIWSPKNDNHQFNGKVMLVDALTHSMNVPTVNLGIALGLPAITDTWQKLGIPKSQLHLVPATILGALNLTPVEVAQVFQTIASGGDRAPLSVLRWIIAENNTVLYQNYLQVKHVFPIQATYITLWVMQQIMKNGTGHQLGEKYPFLHLAGKIGTTNNNIDAWFVGIDDREVVITWVGRDNNQSTKLYGSNGAMLIYHRYLENQSSVPLELVLPESVININIDEMGNIVCDKRGRRLPIWITKQDLDFICQKDQYLQKINSFPFDHSFLLPLQKLK